MPQYTDEQKKQRKHTIKMSERLKILDGGFTPQPQFDIIHHPRAFNKPFSCQMGKHQWETISTMGVPFLRCKKCGEGIPRDVYYQTLTKSEMRANVPNPIKNTDKTDWIQEAVERINARSRR